MNREAVGEKECLALGQVRLNVLLVNGGDGDVGHRDENDVGFLHRLGGVVNLEAMFPGGGDRLAAGVKADDDLHAALFEICLLYTSRRLSRLEHFRFKLTQAIGHPEGMKAP